MIKCVSSAFAVSALCTPFYKYRLPETRLTVALCHELGAINVMLISQNTTKPLEGQKPKLFPLTAAEGFALASPDYGSECNRASDEALA